MPRAVPRRCAQMSCESPNRDAHRWVSWRPCSSPAPVLQPEASTSAVATLRAFGRRPLSAARRVPAVDDVVDLLLCAHAGRRSDDRGARRVWCGVPRPPGAAARSRGLARAGSLAARATTRRCPRALPAWPASAQPVCRHRASPRTRTRRSRRSASRRPAGTTCLRRRPRGPAATSPTLRPPRRAHPPSAAPRPEARSAPHGGSVPRPAGRGMADRAGCRVRSSTRASICSDSRAGV